MNGTTPKFSEDRFKLIKDEIFDFLEDVGYTTKRVPFIPISVLEGVHLIEISTCRLVQLPRDFQKWRKIIDFCEKFMAFQNYYLI